MARTKASAGAKVSAGKSNKARCSVAAAAIPSRTGRSGGGGGKGGNGVGGAGGGNAVCARATPPWQRAITSFFTRDTSATDAAGDDEALEAGAAEAAVTAGSSKHKHKRKVIESDEEDSEPPKNNELDESIHLEPLTGKDSHKLDEYYPKNGEKGKGVGKKTKGKENVNVGEKNNKREREESLEESVSKKVRIEC